MNIIKAWAEAYVADPRKRGPVSESEEAPKTKARGEIIEEGYSPGMRLVADWLDDKREDARTSGRPVVTTDAALQAAIVDKLHGGRREAQRAKSLNAK